MILRLGVMVGVFLSLNSTFGQFNGSNIGEYRASIPDPESDLDVFSFAKNRSVAKEIGLSEESYLAMTKLLQESGGSLDKPTLTVGIADATGFSEQELKLIRPTGEQIKTWISTRIKDNSDQVESILSPSQRDRLRQIAYWIEISRVGLAEALTDGFLGKNSGVENYQVEALRIRAQSIESNLINALRKTVTETQEEYLANLTGEQVEATRKAIGAAFIFRNIDNSLSKFPDPESKSSYEILLQSKDVAIELRLEEREQDELINLFKSKRVRMNGKKASEIKNYMKEVDQKLQEKIDELLDPHQVDRIKQIGFQLEISKVGFVESMVNGYLGKKVGLNEDQKRTLRNRAPAIEKKSNESIATLLNAACEELLAELHPLQSRKAKGLLGKAFVYQEWPLR